MGRLTGPASRRRDVLGRPLLVFALLLLGPAAGFCVLGWRSVVREHEYRVREMHRSARDLLDQRVHDAAADAERVREREEKRHYYEYQEAYLPKEQVVETLGFQKSSLTLPPAERLVVGYFQWELFDGKTYENPQVFPQEQAVFRARLEAAYGEALREKLQRAPHDVELQTGRGRVERYSQRVVAANEEVGQLQEELELERNGGRPEELQYLRSFRSRAREAPVRVRYTPFRYLARPRGAAGPPLVAWRMVWVAAEQVRWREVKRDRWLLQGYALDPASLFPDRWESIGTSLIVRGDRLGGAPGVSASVQSLAVALDAELAGPAPAGADPASAFDPSLELAARADLGLAEAAWRDARNRYLLLVAGLLVVVGVGFFVLVRSVRHEVRLARRKEDFIAAVTHELKTPLTGIRMYADMLREGWVASPEAAGQYAGRILEESERLGHLVDQVLDLAALERGVTAVHALPGDMGEAVRGAVALMESRARQAGVALELEIEPGLPQVPFDERLVRPLVLNLVDNGVKYSARSATKEVRVGLRREGERIVLSVADRGVGIPLKAQRSVFQPFQRGGDELTRSAPGVGIGLALVKRYADAHDARIHLASVPGRGTTVEVRFRIPPRTGSGTTPAEGRGGEAEG